MAITTDAAIDFFGTQDTLGTSSADVTDTSLTTVYTVPTATSSIVKSVRVVNVDPSNAAIVSLNVVTSAGTSYALDIDRTIPAKTSDEFMKVTADSFHSNPLILEASEVLKIQNSAAGQLNVVASIMQVTNDI